MAYRFIPMLLFCIATLPMVAMADNGSNGLVFGVFPHMPLNKLYQVYAPMAADFRKSVGKQVTLRSSPSFSAFEKALKSEEYDIALIQPFDYPDAHDNHHYLPLARRGVPLQTIIVVNKNSKYQKLSDLMGKHLAAPAPSAAVTVMLKRDMKNAELDPEKYFRWSYSLNHFACLQRVLIKEADSCVTAVRALKHWESVKLEEKFRIVHMAESIPHVLFVVHERVPEHERKLIKQKILGWPNSKKGQEILSRGNMVPFKEALDKEYDVLRQ